MAEPAVSTLWLVLKAATVAVLVASAVLVLRHKHRREAPFLAVLFICLATYRAATLWNILPTLGLPPVGVMMLAQCAVTLIPPSLAAGFFISNGRLSPSARNMALLYAIPAVSIGMTLTNQWHGWMWNPATFSRAWVELRHPEWGLWFTLIHAPYSYGLMLLSILGVLAQLASPMRVFRHQAIALLISVTLPLAMNLRTTFGDGTPSFVLVESAFFFGSVVLSWGLIRFQLFRIAPIAHEAILASVADGVLVIADDEHVIEANAAARALLHLDAAPAQGPLDVVLASHPALVAHVRLPRSPFLTYHPEVDREVEVELRTLTGRGTRDVGRLVLIRDLTEQRRAESALREREALLDTIVRSSPNGILTVVPSGGEAGWPRDFECVQANPAADRFLGHDRPLVGARLSETPLVHRALLTQLLRDTVLRGVTASVVLDAPDRGRWFEVTSTPAGRTALVTVVDITDRKVREDAMARMANVDALTGLFNRRGFEADAAAMMERLAANGAAVAIFYLDLDGFKPANDMYGHAVGDAILAELGKRLRRCFRDNVLLARMGGDEFVVLIPEIREASVPSTAERALVSLSAPYHVNGHEVVCPASLGTSWGWAREADLQSLVDRADRAMLATKDASRRTSGAGSSGR